MTAAFRDAVQKSDLRVSFTISPEVSQSPTFRSQSALSSACSLELSPLSPTLLSALDWRSLSKGFRSLECLASGISKLRWGWGEKYTQLTPLSLHLTPSTSSNLGPLPRNPNLNMTFFFSPWGPITSPILKVGTVTPLLLQGQDHWPIHYSSYCPPDFVSMFGVGVHHQFIDRNLTPFGSASISRI